MPGSTQNFVKIKSIKDGVVILKSGAVLSVMLVSSVNFSLKSEDEQKAITYRFQEFLNSLDFSLQIVIQSRDLNISTYLEEIKKKEKRQEDELLHMQTKEYYDFIESLVETTDIMEKNFYLVVPYSLGESKAKQGIKAQIMSLFGSEGLKTESKEFKQMKQQLWRRVDHVASGIKSMGMRAAPLTTQELAELFFDFYNPTAKPEKDLADISQLDLE